MRRNFAVAFVMPLGLLTAACSRAPAVQRQEETVPTEHAAPVPAEPTSHLSSTGPAKSDASPEELASFAESVNKLTVDLYRRLSAGSGNLFFSPYSISMALTMTYSGARGSTAEQMRSVLGLRLADARLHPAAAALALALRAGGGITLRVANGLWISRGHAFVPAYLELVRRYYAARVDVLDFSDEPAARAAINRWVGRQTEGKIEDLIPPQLLDSLTRLVLANAIYFKGTWATQFDPAHTQNLDFYVHGGGAPAVPTMQRTDRFPLYNGRRLQALELPYSGDALSMLVILPKARDGLPALERDLDAERLAGWSAGLKRQKVAVSLPRFEIEGAYSLIEPLQALGMVDAFNHNAADFEGINGEKDDLYIAAALHRAFVEVNEEGTEAAAATAVVVASRGRSSPIPEFRADHPFMFFIRHRATGAVLFAGRVLRP